MHRFLTNVGAIFRRELASHFNSALAYIIVPAFLLLVGGFSLYFQDILAAGVATMRTASGFAASVLGGYGNSASGNWDVSYLE